MAVACPPKAPTVHNTVPAHRPLIGTHDGSFHCDEVPPAAHRTVAHPSPLPPTLFGSIAHCIAPCLPHFRAVAGPRMWDAADVVQIHEVCPFPPEKLRLRVRPCDLSPGLVHGPTTLITVPLISAEIVRSRDPAVLAQCDIVVDVGAVYDPDTDRCVG
eukprot:gene9307-8363_t